MKKFAYITFRVEWSEEDQEFFGLCSAFPSLSHGDPDPTKALIGINKLVKAVIEDISAEEIQEFTAGASLCETLLQGSRTVIDSADVLSDWVQFSVSRESLGQTENTPFRGGFVSRWSRYKGDEPAPDVVIDGGCKSWRDFAAEYERATN